jgi:hypothetical protein
MSIILSHFLALAVFCSISWADVARPTECDMWEDASRSTMKQEFLNVTCLANSFCTGFHCSGQFLFQNHVFRGSEPFGFTVDFIPCSYPLVMRIRINATNLHFMKMIGVNGRNEDAILLVMPGSSGFEEPFGRLNLAWNSILKPVKYFVNLEVNFTRIYMTGEFLPITIVPPRNFPIPNCHYEAKPEAEVTYSPKGKGCVGLGCEENTPAEETVMTVDREFIMKMCVGVGVFLIALCLLLAIVLVRRHRGSKHAQRLEVEEDESSSEDEIPSSASQSSLDDKKILLRV